MEQWDNKPVKIKNIWSNFCSRGDLVGGPQLMLVVGRWLGGVVTANVTQTKDSSGIWLWLCNSTKTVLQDGPVCKMQLDTGC